MVEKLRPLSDRKPKPQVERDKLKKDVEHLEGEVKKLKSERGLGI